MQFTTPVFFAFLPILFLLYLILKDKYRWILLLLASFYFYICIKPVFGLFLLYSIIITYFCGIAIEKASANPKKKRFLAYAIIASLLPLLFCKYLNFSLMSITNLLQTISIPIQPATIKLLLPLGISFYTFQTVGYLIDVYRGTIPSEKRFGYYALFVSFFPQVISGPIGRAGSLLPQFKKAYKFNYEKTAYGLKLMAWGYFKKLVVAGWMAIKVDDVFASLHSYIGLILIVIIIMFAFQIYCDFSGYTDIARGTALLFGIELADNFNAPYLAHSIQDFWHRWHISLSTWFRDYLYIPLGGSRKGKLRKCLNLMITFLVSGLWHGANWTFVLWGGLHGLLQVIETTFFKKKKFPILIVFPIICITWIFFRAKSLADILYIFQNAFNGVTDPIWYLKIFVISMNMPYAQMIWLCIPIIILILFDIKSQKKDVIASISQQHFLIRWPVYIIFMTVLVLFSQKGVSTDFIYNQF